MRVDPWIELYRYWCAHFIEGRPPSRRDIDPPLEIPQLSGNLILLDAASDGFVYRFIGSVVVRHFARDLTGLAVGSSGGPQGAVDAWIGALREVRESRTPKLIAVQWPKAEFARNVILFLPLVGRGGVVGKILVGSFYQGRFHPGSQFDEVVVEELPLDPPAIRAA